MATRLTAKVVITFECPACGATMKLDFNGQPVATCIFANCDLEGREFLPPSADAVPDICERLREV
mgnify:CR=1 FL=1